MSVRRSRLRASRSLVMAISASLVAGAALSAEGDPVRLMLSESLTHDDNVFRNQSPSVDTVTSVAAGFSVDAHQSRQQFHAEVSATNNRYTQLTYLDNGVINDQLTWQASFPGQVVAEASWSRSQSLASYSDIRNTAKDIVTTDAASLRLTYALTPDWSLSVQIAPVTNTNSAVVDNVNDARIISRELKLEYDSPHGNQVGLLARRTSARYPHLQPIGLSLVSNDYRQDDLQVFLKWSPGAKSTLSLTAGSTHREQVDLPQRNFTGATGQINLVWAPTAKTSFNASMAHDLTAQSTVLANYSIVRSSNIGANWTPTEKISAQIQFGRQWNVFAGNPGFVITPGVVEPIELTRNAALTLQYDAPRLLHLSLQLKHEIRESNQATLAYDSNVATFSANLKY